MRCTSLVPTRTGMYRCMLESRDGHTEHQYNYYRKLTDKEMKIWFPEEWKGLHPEILDFDKTYRIENVKNS